MIVLVNKLTTILEQEVDYTLNKRAHIGAIYPYIVMVGAPTGDFTFGLIKGVTTLFSKTFDCDDIKLSLTTTDNNAHAFYPIIPTNPTQIEKGSYKLRLSASGYTATSTSYLGWAQQFEDIQNEMSYTPSGDEQNSLAFRVKVYKEGVE